MKRIELFGKYGKDKFALVDDEDFINLSRYNWHCDIDKYVITGNTRMHRMLLPNIKLIDHVNGNPLDNQRQNLRLATNAQNLRNKRKTSKLVSSSYIGVSWSKKYNSWYSQIQHHQIGYFKEERHAAMAWDIWAKELYGEFAQLNLGKETNE